jgi:hypothetical protein
MATVGDMWKLAHLWCIYAPRIVQQRPELFAEMHGLIVAAVQLKMPFTLTKSFTVSTTTAHDREGWVLVDQLEATHVCTNSALEQAQIAPQLPVALHYCQRYIVGRHFFSKYRIRKNILQCNKPLMHLPPTDMSWQNVSYGIIPPTADSQPITLPIDAPPLSNENVLEYSPSQLKRETFMACRLIHALNEAMTFFRKHACDGSRIDTVANLNYTYTIFNYPAAY